MESTMASTIESQKIDAEIERLRADSRKLEAETFKLSAEMLKLAAESCKLNRQTRWLPMIEAAGLFGIALAFAKLFLR